MVQYVLIVVDGKGLRTGHELPKQFPPIGGKPVLVRIMEAFYAYNVEIRTILVLLCNQQSYWNELYGKHHFSIPRHVVSDGETRFHSVKNGLAFVTTPRLVGVHNDVRPFVAREVIARCYSLAIEEQTAVPVTDVAETVRHLVGEGSEMVSHDEYKLVQTPQVSNADSLKQAYGQPYTSHFTDDALVVKVLGKSVYLAEGNRENIKIATSFNLKVATVLLGSCPI